MTIPTSREGNTACKPGAAISSDPGLGSENSTPQQSLSTPLCLQLLGRPASSSRGPANGQQSARPLEPGSIYDPMAASWALLSRAKPGRLMNKPSRSPPRLLSGLLSCETVAPAGCRPAWPSADPASSPALCSAVPVMACSILFVNAEATSCDRSGLSGILISASAEVCSRVGIVQSL